MQRPTTLGIPTLLLMIAMQGCSSTPPPAAPQTSDSRLGAPIVFFDIAGPDNKTQSSFYSDIFGWKIAPDGRFSMQVVAPLPAMLRQEGPAHDPRSEKVIYLGVPDISATLARITAAGGSIVYPRLEVPGVVVLGLFKDPAGNRMGLVEMENGKPKVPKAKAP